METFEKGSMAGTVQGNYTYYRFTFTVRGDLSNIRKLVDNLYKAYTEHRIYVVRGISMVKLMDEAATVLAETDRSLQGTGKSARDENPDLQKTNDPNTAGMPPGAPGAPGAPGMPPFGDAPAEKKPASAAEELAAHKAQQEAAQKKKDEDPEKDIPFNERKSYGKPVIGFDKSCQAIIDVDYVVYTGEIK
jgi:hypothetical protein